MKIQRPGLPVLSHITKPSDFQPSPLEAPELKGQDPAFDYVVIDTPQQAAQLPFLEPVFQLSLAAGIMMGGMFSNLGGVQTDMMLRFESQSADVPMSSTYLGRFEPGSKELNVNGGGLVAGNFFSAEQLIAHPDGMRWVGRCGNNDMNLAITADRERQSVYMRGQIGQVATDLTMIPMTNAEGDFIGVETVGNLGGEEYLAETSLKELPTQGLLDGPFSGQLKVEGHLGTELIEKNYSFNSNINGAAGSLEFRVEGGGTNGGVMQQVHSSLQLSPRKD